ncbi:Hypothetical predicted protein [Podarcis lilfordi]|uniref:Uncharacterized protein n=1 Tax=Podarcis lilfordi TaxID=74358 RepID=A0AA35JRH0_9SAUR|nr:Hypothetical predicted protein [Podarcis lilfordi]
MAVIGAHITISYENLFVYLGPCKSPLQKSDLTIHLCAEAVLLQHFLASFLELSVVCSGHALGISCPRRFAHMRFGSLYFTVIPLFDFLFIYRIKPLFSYFLLCMR